MIGRWGLAISLIALAFGLLARFAPAARRAKKWTSLGTALVVSAWIVQSLVFRFYLSAFAEFRTAIGGLVLVLVVTGFFYIAAIVLLVGIEVDELMRKDAK